MKVRIKRLLKDVEGLGFERDDEASSPRRGTHAFRHPNDPVQVLRVSEHMSDSGCTGLWKKAQQIAGLSSTGPTSSTKEMQRVFRSAERAKKDREARERRHRAEEAELEHDRRQVAAKADARRSGIESLMQPGNGR